ncbi:MAG: hypothetical protein EOP19_20950, partial [Hyphomicrobiales bacterium]
MLSKNKSILVASAVLITGMMLGTTVQAGFDRIGAERAGMPRAIDLPALQLRPGYDMLTPVLDVTLTASIAPRLETTAPVRRSAPNYNVFKSVVVPVGKLPAFAQWTEVQPSAGGAGDFCAGSFCDTAAGRKLAALGEAARRLSPVEALDLVNRGVNRAIAYRSDQGDHWQTLAQSAASPRAA